MKQSPKLLVDFCDYRAAKFAVMNWHYSKVMPSSKLIKIGAWENDKFIGVIIFGGGATPEIGKEFNLTKFQTCELVRVALNHHKSFTSQIISRAVRMIKNQSPGLRLIVSFADTNYGHTGAIYQALNWIYTGSKSYHAYMINGNVTHPRTLFSRYGRGGQSIFWLRENIDTCAKRIITEPKHRYLCPLDRPMRRQIQPLSKPYPKRADA